MKIYFQNRNQFTKLFHLNRYHFINRKTEGEKLHDLFKFLKLICEWSK